MRNFGRETPSIILARPQMGENIGAAARVMRNFGLKDLRLVAPRDGWPNEKADAMAAGAADVLDHALIADDVAGAVAGLTLVFAATARPRDMVKPALTPREAIGRARAEIARGGRAGFLFGAEASGLNNEEIVLADAILTIPVDPAFSSLNLAQAIAVTVYEWRASDAPPDGFDPDVVPADKKDLAGLQDYLISELEAADHFRPAEKAAIMKRNLRSALARGGLTLQEVQSLRGAFKALAEKRKRGA